MTGLRDKAERRWTCIECKERLSKEEPPIKHHTTSAEWIVPLRDVDAAVTELRGRIDNLYRKLGKVSVWKATNDEVADMAEEYIIRTIDSVFGTSIKDSEAQQVCGKEGENRAGRTTLSSPSPQTPNVFWCNACEREHAIYHIPAPVKEGEGKADAPHREDGEPSTTADNREDVALPTSALPTPQWEITITSGKKVECSNCGFEDEQLNCIDCHKEMKNDEIIYCNYPKHKCGECFVGGVERT